MMLFWTLATAMVVAVLVLLLRPLLRTDTEAAAGAATDADEATHSNLRVLRDALAELDAELDSGALDAERHAQARSELQRRVLEEAQPAATGAHRTGGARASAFALALLLPALAVLLYAQLGERRALDPAALRPAPAASPDIEALVQRLAERMQAQPEDPQGWRLLGRAYAGLQRYELARDAYREAVQRSAPDPDLLADYADALASTLDGKLEGEPERLALQALGLNPDQPKALALAGSAAFERGDARAALAHWTRARRLAPDGSPFAQGLDAGIREASVLAGLAPPAAAQPAAQAAAHSASAAAPGAGLQVKVQLAPALAARLQPGDTLFVFARAAEGSRMPLAVARLPAGAGPLQVRLDDGSAMSPQTRLSSQSQVVVGARISRSGDATPQPGDLEGESAPVAASGQVELLIDRVRP